MALPLEFPSTAIRAATETESFGSQRLPITGYDGGAMQTIWAEGAIRKDAWQMVTGQQTTLQILVPLRDQLAVAGYDVIFECADTDCGGFDFRYALPVLPEPDMHVDLGDFRYLAAQRSEGADPEYLTLLVSRSAERGFIQVTTVGGQLPAVEELATATKSPFPNSDPSSGPVLDDDATAALPVEVEALPLPDILEAKGRAVLRDLSFRTGSSELDEAEFGSLLTLATYLKAQPDRAVVLVGHTDAEGALESNIALSRRRADAVRARLVTQLGVPSVQVVAEGVGYLSPLTSNQTEAGRSANRRVEVILK
jgi:OOP family OmpA-OmpF porin